MEQACVVDGAGGEAVGGRGGRWDEVAILAAHYQGRDSGKSLAEIAREHGLPDSPLRHWVGRLEASDGPPAWTRFFESPAGLQLLHMIVVAAILVITLFCGGGVRAVCLFLQLSGLWRFVAAGYGTQCAAIQQMEERIGEFGDLQRERLAPKMPAKPITLTEDENFHDGKPCLVASEPSSDLLLIEEYADNRQAETWTAKVKQALKGLPVEVVQITSDDARALVKHAKESLGVHHSPDLFHPQQDISRATSLTLGRNVADAEKDLAKAEKARDEIQQEAQAYAQARRGPGRPRNYPARIRQAEEQVAQAQATFDEARQRQETVRKEARGLSQSYHPFDLATAKVRDAATVEHDLNGHFDAIEEAATEAGISGKCWGLLKKARRLVPKMVATITFVHTKIHETVHAIEDASEPVKEALLDYLIPLLYLKEVARKATTADARDAVLRSCERLKERSQQAIVVLDALGPEKRASLEHVARICAQFFQRSSSNVEGRNGFLALLHHSLHHLCPRKLRALTVIHNYMIRRRSDGLTPAERFFEQSHDDLFQYLLMTLPPPKRPAARRSVVPHAVH
jgi:hypothetical protein